MNRSFQDQMAHATALTRSGRLQEATQVLQTALSGALPGTARPPPPATSDPWPWVDEVLPGDAVCEPPKSPPRPAPGLATDAGSTLSGSHAGKAGERAFRLYVPPQAGSGPLPLVVMLHGCTQDPDDFAAGTAMNEAARERGCYVLYPAQSQQANPQRCWNWFKHTHQQRGRGEPALLAGMVAQVRADHRVDPSRVFVAGLSAGGAMAAILGCTYPEVFAAVGVHSGLAAGAAKDLPTALQAMQSGGQAPLPGAAVRTIVFHGSQDGTVHPRNGEQVIAAMTGAARRETAPAPAGRRSVTRQVWRHDDGRIVGEHWLVHGAAHAWSGGSTRGSYTDAAGPDATREMLRFFLDE
jgi:poly(hydroxyalkanoate) depolymerase family esterase